VALFAVSYVGAGLAPAHSFTLPGLVLFQLWEDCCAVLMQNWSAFPFENNLYV